MSDRVTATADGPVSIDLLASWFADQAQPDTGCDVSRWWQAHDRTTGRELPITGWSLEADGRTVTVQEALAGHVYTVSFLATQVWDPTQMYNYLTNGWGDDPSRVREKLFDVRHEATWAHVRSHLSAWLSTHPEVDVVRFTTFFYHFTLVYGTDAAERYGEHFAATGIDAVVGSVGPGATCRMIADIPHVRYTEGRFLPYFFPDVFHPGGDPVAEANHSWLEARRAIVRSPLDRIGYGGYLSLAVEHPDFIDRVEQIVAEFRAIHERSAGLRPLTPGFKVAVINSWGRLRSWMTHMVAHALWYRQTYTYLGVLEALSGLPVDVEFLSFDDVRAGLAPDVKVLICSGAEGTAFSGGEQWADAELVAQVSSFVAAGGGLIGVGAPSAHPAHGVTFQLADVLGVDREIGWGLSTRRRPPEVEEHFITRDLTGGLDDGEGTPDIVVTSPATRVLDAANGQVRLAVHELGRGRAVYATGLPYSAQNSRLLHRAIFWAAGRQEEFSAWAALDPRVEVAAYPDGRTTLAINNSLEPVTTTVPTPQGPRTIRLEAGGHQWLTAASQ